MVERITVVKFRVTDVWSVAEILSLSSSFHWSLMWDESLSYVDGGLGCCCVVCLCVQADSSSPVC